MSTPMSTLENRLTELEIRLSFLDEALHGLLATDAERAMRLDRLERIVTELRLELAGVRIALAPDMRSEPPPPHY
jgi:SlyX protein